MPICEATSTPKRRARGANSKATRTAAPSNRAQFLKLVRAAAKQSSYPLSCPAFARHSGLSPWHYQRYFKTWRAALDAAGVLKPALTRERLLELVRQAGLDAAPQGLSLARFAQVTGLHLTAPYAFFDTWRECKRAAGLPPAIANRSPRLIADDVLMRAIHRVALANGGRPPTGVELRQHTSHVGALYLRFKSLRNMHDAYRKWLASRDTQQFALDQAERAAIDAARRGKSAPHARRRVAAKVKRQPRTAATAAKQLAVDMATMQIDFGPAPADGSFILGEPLAHPAITHAPLNEAGVLVLFGALAEQLGYRLRAVRATFPDAELQRRLPPRRRGSKPRWETLRAEFEFESRNFLAHCHDATACDLIVCWRDNWPACPLPVLALQDALPGLLPPTQQ